MEYSNPRKILTVLNWPYGNKRCKCSFYVESNKGKERAVRETTNPKTGSMNKPKKMTYAMQVLFMDGDDGKTYIVQDTGFLFSIMQSNMKYQEEYFGNGDPRYQRLARIFHNFATAKDIICLEDYQGLYEQDGAEVLELTVKKDYREDVAEAILKSILTDTIG